MGIAYRCDSNLRCTFVVWDGDVTPRQWQDRERSLFDDPAFPPGPLVLADLSTSRAPSITNEAIDEMAASWRDSVPKMGSIKMAILPDGAWDKARRFEREVDGSGIRTIVFTSLHTACVWLGLEPSVALSVLDELRAGLRR